MYLDAKWYRLRFLNAAISRPWLIKIKDAATGADVHHTICKSIASDGGYREAAVDLGPEGLQIGVAERYELACNFTAMAGKTLYLW
jgi:FtsP/CotA-like multicopper oxidase with cupredoxin domain